MKSNLNILEASGHRKRLRKRYLSAPIRTTPDYEILEMLLYYVIRQADTKQSAKRLLNKFGSLVGVINADINDIMEVDGIGEASLVLFKLLSDLYSRLFVPFDAENKQFNILNNWHAVLNYCRLTMGYQKKKEFFRVLYLNKKNHLLADEFNDNGTIDRVAIYPREIARKVITLGASAIILIHNHPSGDPKPSNDDLEITKNIIKVLEPINAKVHDHLIISGFDHFSFKGNNLL